MRDAPIESMQTTQTNKSIQILSPGDRNHPLRLHDLHDPPNPLYIYGDIELLKLPMIALVGVRMASPQGRDCEMQLYLHGRLQKQVLWSSRGWRAALMVPRIRPA